MVQDYKFIGMIRQSGYIAGRSARFQIGLFMFKHACLAFLLGGAMLAGTCMAHAKLQSSSPSDGAQLTQAPKTLTLNFSEAAQLAMLRLVSDGKEISIPIDKTAKAAPSVTLPLPLLTAGKYAVQWTALAADGHVSKGSFVFSIAA
jgi:methionine-rich copper-binding protein CopC